MNHIEARQDHELAILTEQYNETAKELLNSLGPEDGVQIILSKINHTTGKLDVLINSTPKYIENQTPDYLMTLDLETLTVDGYVFFMPKMTYDEEKGRIIKDFSAKLPRKRFGGRGDSIYNEAMDTSLKTGYDKFVILRALERYILESDGEFFNIAKKKIGREISKEEVIKLFESWMSFLSATR
jgi:hypothetical protein